MPSDRVLILASSSARRRELLEQAGVLFEVVPCPLPEPVSRPSAAGPAAWAEALAHFKARAVADAFPRRRVLGADTLVHCGEVLGKPADAADARRMLESQAGRATDVITGLCLAQAWPSRAARRVIAHAVTRVWMRDDPQEREAYLRSGDWAGKAGAYGIQDVGDRLVERIEGSYSNVVGLPVELLRRMLAHVERTWVAA